MNQKFNHDLPVDRWESGQRLKLSKVKLLCARCGVLRTVDYFKPLSKRVVLADCGHERSV